MKKMVANGRKLLILAVVLLFVVIGSLSVWADGNGTNPTPSSSPAGKATDLPERNDEEIAKQEQRTKLVIYTCGGITGVAVIVLIRQLTKKKPEPVRKVEGTGLTEPLPKNGFAEPGHTEPFPQKDDFVISNKTQPIPEDYNETQPLEDDGGSGRQMRPALALSCKGGYMDGREFPVNRVVTIGRAPSCSVKYPEDYPAVSWQHAELRIENGELSLCDSSSTGTLLKRFGKVIPKGERIPVNVGDVFYIGERKNRFEIVAKF